MNTLRFTLKAVGLFLCSVILQATAQAQPEQTYVSTAGNDGGTCPQPAPCRTIDYALSQVANKGTVIVLKSGRYKPFTVDKSVSVVVAPGAYAEIVSSNNAVTIISPFSHKVVLRGLALRGASGGVSGNGIQVISQVTTDDVQLSIENCIISQFNTRPGYGIYFSSPGNLVIKDTTVRDCLIGMYISGGKLSTVSADTAFALIERCRIETNQNDGILASGGAFVTVRDSIAAYNERGVNANSPDAKLGTAQIFLKNCVVSGFKTGVQTTGVQAGANAGVRVSNSIVQGDIALLTVSDGRIYSRQNNTIQGSVVATLIPFSAQ